MRFCIPHWEALKKAITVRGLNDLVPVSGEEAMKREVSHMEGQKITRANFDPLMGAHWTLVNNAMEYIQKVGGNPLALMVQNPDHPEHECPICYLNFLSDEHDRLCLDPNCPKEKGLRFEHWIDKAADGCVEYVKNLPAE
jgi:hypothetical protein